MTDSSTSTPRRPVAGRAMRKTIGWRIWQQLPLIVALVVLWMLLWGSIGPLAIISGIVLAFSVSRALFLPPVELSGRLNPLWLVVFLARFAVELVRGSFEVAFRAFGRNPQTRNAVIAVDLLSRSDFIMTLTSITVSLIPGSLVIEVDRARSILYLHILNVTDDATVDRHRREILIVERDIVRALGSPTEVRALSTAVRHPTAEAATPPTTREGPT